MKGERVRREESSSSLCFTPYMATMTGAGPDRSQEPGTPCWSLTSVAGTQVLESSFCTFPSALAGTWARSGAAGTSAITHMEC